MKTIKVAMYGVMLGTAGLLSISVLFSVDPKASILRGIDEPTVNAYEDMYAAEAENATSTSRSNATSIENNTGFQ